MKKIIYFDIDNTLINTRILARLFYEKMAKETGLSIEKIIEIQKNYASGLESHTDFYPNDLIEHIGKTIGGKSFNFKNIFDNETFYKQALFSETIEILKELKNDYLLGIYSEGFEDYQTRKLILSGIIDYFNKDLMIIKRRKLENNSVSEIKNGSIVVDDNKEVIEALNKFDNFGTVWINRKNETMVEDVKAIENLFDLKRFLV